MRERLVIKKNQEGLHVTRIIQLLNQRRSLEECHPPDLEQIDRLNKNLQRARTSRTCANKRVKELERLIYSLDRIEDPPSPQSTPPGSQPETTPPPEPVPVDHLQLELDSWNSLDIDHLEVEGPPSEMLLHYFFGHAGVPLCASLCMSTRFRLNKGMCCLAMSGARRFYLSTF
jgi:hypothetical protein